MLDRRNFLQGCVAAICAPLSVIKSEKEEPKWPNKPVDLETIREQEMDYALNKGVLVGDIIPRVELSIWETGVIIDPERKEMFDRYWKNYQICLNSKPKEDQPYTKKIISLTKEAIRRM
jgi:hypothetical protein